MKSQKTKLLNQNVKKGLVLYLKSYGNLFKRNGAISSKTVELFPKGINASRMKELWPHFIVAWCIFLSVTQARYKHLRKSNTRSVDTFNHKRKLEYQYPDRTGVYLQRLTKVVRHVRGNIAEFYSNINQRSKRGNSDAAHGEKLGQMVSHDSTLLPQPAKPLRVVATSAVIKNRRKKPRPLKAIHIWGLTPFKTVLQNLQRLNNNIQKQRGAVKRLFLPVQLQRMQLLSALGKSPLPGPVGLYLNRFSGVNPAGHFHVAPDDIHLQEGPPALSHVQGPVRFTSPAIPVPSETVLPFHEQGPMHMQESGPLHDFPPVDAVPSVRKISPMHEVEPDNIVAPLNYDEIAPMRELEAARDMPTTSELDPTSQSFDKSFNVAPNLEPPNTMFAPPFPWMAGEIHEEVNRHVNKGKLL